MKKCNKDAAKEHFYLSIHFIFFETGKIILISIFYPNTKVASMLTSRSSWKLGTDPKQAYAAIT